MPARTGAAAAVLGLLVVTGLAGCGSSGGGSSSGDSGTSDSVAVPAPQRGVADGSSGADTGSTGGSSTGGTDVQTRSVISTGQVQLQGDPLSDVRAKIDALMEKYDGFVAKEQTQNDAHGTMTSSVLVLRVPSASFETVMGSFADFSTVLDKSSKEEDVTTEVIDVNSRIRTQEVSLKRLQKFLGQAKSVPDVIRLESAIAQREADLASLRSQHNYLKDQTSLATITVRMALPPEKAAQDDPLADAGFLTGLRNGWNALVDVAVVAATVLGAMLPFLLVLAVILVPLVLWLRSRHRRPTEETPPPGAATGAPLGTSADTPGPSTPGGIPPTP